MADLKKRGDAILVVMQALRAHRAVTTAPAEGQYDAFEEAATVFDALQDHAFIDIPAGDNK